MKPFYFYGFIFTVVVIAAPFMSAKAASQFSYSGWLPFWKQRAGVQDVSLVLDKFKEISPFSYEVGAGGMLIDKLKISGDFWSGWLAPVRDMKIKIVPTIAWFNGRDIHVLLSDKKRRVAQEDAIAKLVKDRKFDGIDIDYESKFAETKPFFSLFIKGLALRLHPSGKILSCTIESRTPLSSLRPIATEDVKYANDYSVLNKYCDEVRVMAYDQGLIDIKLNVQKGNGHLYAPVADPLWVKKVLGEVLKTINRRKVALGVPTYGYEYQVTCKNGQIIYERLRSHTFFEAMNRADLVGVTPERNSAGELSFAYATSTRVTNASPELTLAVSSDCPSEITALDASSAAIRLVSFSDAESAAQKIALAKKLGLRGVSFFKLDGQGDPLLWEKMK